jgi:NitT/TauT family transport system substrate-binding protein
VVSQRLFKSGAGPGGCRLLSISFFSLLVLTFSIVVFLSEQEAKADSEPLQKAVLLLDWYPQAENAGYVCAQISGFYRQAGFDVEIRPLSMSPSSQPLAQLALNKIQFCMTGADQVLIARSRGFPVKCAMATMQHCPIALMVHAESPVKSFSDLSGHNISVAPGYAWYRYIIKKYHLQNVGELRFTGNSANFALDPTYIQQCLITAEPYFMEHRGIKVRTLMVKDTGYDPYRVLATSDPFIAANPSAVHAVVDASTKGWRSYLQDPKATDAELLRLNPQMTQDQLDYSRGILIKDHFIDGDSSQGEDVGQVNPNRMETLYGILHEEGFIPTDYDYHSTLLPPLSRSAP